jgi:hypothetical protein
VKEENIPLNFELYQNYPNPFNSGTKIKYQIPKNELVTLKVFDMLGREVDILVDEYQEAGIYEVSFNGNKNILSSGIYFYKIYAGDYTSIKRMVLVK